MARIRTIKPEFWTDEDMSEVSESACLLAIGLLNYADDEGYFNANPKLIKAAIFPIREQSRSIPVLMQELSSVGYISLFSGPDSKIYGLVNNFSKHQVINKAKKSVIKHLCTVPYQYGIDTGGLPPGREGKGKEGKGIKETAEDFFPPVDNSEQPPQNDSSARNALLNGYAPLGGSCSLDKFGMSEDWQPDNDFLRRAALWGVNLTGEVTPEELADFVTYWKAEGKAFHHDQWMQKLARSVQQSRTQKQPGGGNKRHDAAFKACHEAVDYSGIPDGFTG